MTAPDVTTAVERAKRKWDRATLDWSRDTHADAVKTMQNGENMMFAAIELICAQESELDRLSAALGEAREALADIGIYGCGMLNQPAAMNAPNEQWLERRIAEYERRARTALQQQEQ